MNEGGTVVHEGTAFAYAVTRSARRRKTIAIAVDAAGCVQVVAPRAVTATEIRGLVVRRAGWILGRLSQIGPPAPARTFVTGEKLPWRGRELTLDVREIAARWTGVHLDGDAVSVSVPAQLSAEARRKAVGAALGYWYVRAAEEHIRTAVDRWSAVAGYVPARVLVRNQRRRWGSCAPDGTLRFNWRLVLAAPTLLDYVVVHELAHLAQPNHSPAFWAEVAKIMPGYRRLRQELKEAGPRLLL